MKLTTIKNLKLTLFDTISHKIGRDIDDILQCVDDVIVAENKVKEIERRLEDTILMSKLVVMRRCLNN